MGVQAVHFTISMSAIHRKCSKWCPWSRVMHALVFRLPLPIIRWLPSSSHLSQILPPFLSLPSVVPTQYASLPLILVL